MNPVVAASTALAYAFDWRIVFLRLSLGYGIAVVIGLLMGRLFAGRDAVREDDLPVMNHLPSCGCHHHEPKRVRQATHPGNLQTLPVLANSEHSVMPCGRNHPASAQWLSKARAALAHARDDFFAVGHYLVIGAFIAALAQTYVNRSWFLNLTALPVLSVILMMILAILLNLCSEADAFIAASFRGLMPVPAQIAFLLTGPMFDLKLLLMYQSVFKRKAIIVLASLILSTVLAISVGLVLINGGIP